MQRRALLGTVGALFPGVVAGCLGRDVGSIDGGSQNDDPAVDGQPLYEPSLDVTGTDSAGVFDATLDIEVVADTVTDAEPAAICVSLTNDESVPLVVSSGPGWPFGVLTLDRERDDGELVRVPFWSERYAQSEHIPDDAENVTATDDVAVRGDVDAGGVEY